MKTFHLEVRKVNKLFPNASKDMKSVFVEIGLKRHLLKYRGISFRPKMSIFDKDEVEVHTWN